MRGRREVEAEGRGEGKGAGSGRAWRLGCGRLHWGLVLVRAVPGCGGMRTTSMLGMCTCDDMSLVACPPPPKARTHSMHRISLAAEEDPGGLATPTMPHFLL